MVSGKNHCQTVAKLVRLRHTGERQVKHNQKNDNQRSTSQQPHAVITCHSGSKHTLLSSVHGAAAVGRAITVAEHRGERTNTMNKPQKQANEQRGAVQGRSGRNSAYLAVCIASINARHQACTRETARRSEGKTRTKSRKRTKNASTERTTRS